MGRASLGPHATYHRDGELHHKSFGQQYGEQWAHKPDASFRGIKQFTQTPLTSGDGKALNVQCDLAKFDRIFEIPDQQLRTSLSNPSWISIDITDTHATPQPILELGQRTIKQERLYDESVPFLWATWFELAPVKVETEAEAETRRAQEMELARLVIENLQAKQQELAEGTNERLDPGCHLDRMLHEAARAFCKASCARTAAAKAGRHPLQQA